MKEVVINWRGRDITVKYHCFKRGKVLYATVIDKKGEAHTLHRRWEDDRWVWRGDGVMHRWPDDLTFLLSDIFEKEGPENVWVNDNSR